MFMAQLCVDLRGADGSVFVAKWSLILSLQEVCLKNVQMTNLKKKKKKNQGQVWTKTNEGTNIPTVANIHEDTFEQATVHQKNSVFSTHMDINAFINNGDATFTTEL